MPNQTVSLTDFSGPYSTEINALRRRQRMADMLQEQATAPTEQFSYNGIPATYSPTQGLAKIAQMMLAGYANKKSGDEEKAIGDKIRSDADSWMSKIASNGSSPGVPAAIPGSDEIPPSQGMSKQERLAALMQGMQNPMTAPVAQSLFAQDARDQAPFNLNRGETRYGPDGKIIAQNTQTVPGDIPMNVREWEYYQKLSPADQKAFLDMKRAPQFLDTGAAFIPRPTNMPSTPSVPGATPAAALSQLLTQPAASGMPPSMAAPQVPPNLVAGAVPGSIPKTLSPGELPSTRGAQAQAAAVGAKTGEKQVEAPAAAAHVMLSMDPLDRLEKTASELRDAPGIDRITGLMSYMPNVTGDARNAQAKMKELKSQIAQNVLLMYRQMSSTGGAVGQVSNFEQEMFQNNLAALDQAQEPDQFKKELNNIIDFVKGSKQRIQDAYKMTYGPDAPAPMQPAAPKAGGWSITPVP